jgi:arylsulfatase A-like enzyme
MRRGASSGPAFQLNENGRIVAYDERPEHYSTDVLARLASDFVDRATAASTPFFLYVATLVPHFPALPAPRHVSAFPNAQAPRPPSFDEPDTTDKPTYLRDAPRLTTKQVRAIDEHHADRLRSLMSLDELISGLMEALRAGGAAGQTFIFVTSDHGWHQGEHRLPFGKETPYEEAIRGPLGVLGPEVLAGETVGALALNIDLAPTVAQLAGATVPNFVDGRSLAPLLFGPTPTTWRRSFLVEHAAAEKTRTYPGLGSMPAVPSYRALRFSDFSADFLFAEHETGERELYDLRADPHQMENAAAGVMPETLARLSTQLDDLQCCAGSRCRIVEDASLEHPVESASD